MSVLNYVPRVPSYPTCFTCLCALRAFVPLLLTCLHFFPCLTCLHFLRALRAFNFLEAFIFLCALRAFIFYVSCVPSFFYVPYVPSIFHVPCVPSFFTCFYLFMYMLIKLTQILINLPMITRCSSLLLFNSIIYQCLSSVLTSVKLVSYSA